jgi:hypothetical protein
VLRSEGGILDNCPVTEITGNGGGRKRMLIKTGPKQYLAGTSLRQVRIVAIWHTSKDKNATTGGADDRLHLRLFDEPVGAKVPESGTGCPEEPDTDVLEEQPVTTLNDPPPVSDEGP